MTENSQQRQEDILFDLSNNYKIDDRDLDNLRRTAVLTFVNDNHGNISSRYNGRLVYRDRASIEVIRPGETWIVALIPNPSSDRNYFAAAIQRIDSSFLFELKKDQIDEIADALWNTQREKIEPIIIEKYAELHRSEVEKEVETAMTSVNAELSAAKDKLSALEKRNMEDTKIIESMRAQLERRSFEVPVIRRGTRTEASDPFQIPDVTVRRIGPDTITSEFFTKDRYSVHVSADLRLMVMVPDPDGTVICIDHIITLQGLNTIKPYSGNESDMVTKYSPEYGGVAVFF